MKVGSDVARQTRKVIYRCCLLSTRESVKSTVGFHERQSVDELDAASLETEPEEFLALIPPLAEARDAAGQCRLADAYDDGTLPSDREKTVAWYRKSAEQGYLRAEYCLGSMTSHGMGAAQDYKEATRGFEMRLPKAIYSHNFAWACCL